MVFVLKAFENKVSLFVLKLLDLILGAHIVVLQLARTGEFIRALGNLCVEHVRTEVEHSALVNFVVLILVRGLLGVAFNEKTDLVAELALALAHVRVVLLQV